MYRLIAAIGCFLLMLSGSFAQEQVDFKTINNESYRFYTQQKWDSLILMNKEDIVAEVDYFYLRMRLGIAYYSTKNYRKASTHFEKALEFNQGDPGALEYLYFSMLFSGQMAQANLIRKEFKGELAQKLPPQKGKFFDRITAEYLYHKGTDEALFEHVEEVMQAGKIGAQSLTRHYANASLSLVNRLAPGVSLHHTYTYLSKSNQNVYSNGSEGYYMSEQQVIQNQYYISPQITTPTGGTFSPMFHLLGIRYQIPLQVSPEYQGGSGYQGGSSQSSVEYVKETDFAMGLGYQKGLGSVDLHLGGWYSQLNLANQLQGRFGLNWFPRGNLNLYAGGFLNGQYEFSEGREGLIRIIPELLFGFAIAEKVWIDLNGAFGELTNYLENNGMIVFNSFSEVINKKIKCSVIFPITEKGSNIYVGGIWSTHTSEIYPIEPVTSELTNTIFYNAYSIYGGLSWKF
jgi:tetratricopeptide (TPR) repeat protein